MQVCELVFRSQDYNASFMKVQLEDYMVANEKWGSQYYQTHTGRFGKYN